MDKRKIKVIVSNENIKLSELLVVSYFKKNLLVLCQKLAKFSAIVRNT